jgi:hypothetical protein
MYWGLLLLVLLCCTQLLLMLLCLPLRMQHHLKQKSCSLPFDGYQLQV